jgi:hypothetical protein
MDLRPIGLLAIFGGWAAVYWMLRRWPGERRLSISQRGAVTPQAQLEYGIIMSGCAGLFGWFMIGWFAPVFALSPTFTTLMVLATMLHLIFAWVPDSSGWRLVAHRGLAYAWAAIIPVMQAIILVQVAQGVLTTLIAAVGLAYMLFGWFLFAFWVSARRHYLIYQVAYIAAFHATVLSISFLQSPVI